MIIENASKTETTAENKYNIEVTAKTFRSLFGDLYSKPFESMIREIVAMLMMQTAEPVIQAQ